MIYFFKLKNKTIITHIQDILELFTARYELMNQYFREHIRNRKIAGY